MNCACFKNCFGNFLRVEKILIIVETLKIFNVPTARLYSI